MPDLLPPTTAKEQFSLAFIRAIATVAGFTATKPDVDDDSVDLVLAARGIYGSLRSPRLEIQVKCTGSSTFDDDSLVFPGLSMKNYDDLRGDTLVPRLLVVVVVDGHDVERWIRHAPEELALLGSARWVSLFGMPEISNQASTTVRLPRDNNFNVASLRSLMQSGGRP
jgi:hypothetical protein